MADQGSTTNLVLEGGTEVGVKSRIHVGLPMPLGVQPEQTLLRLRAFLLQAAAPTDPKPLAESSPMERQHPCALLQQWRVSLCPSSSCKPLVVP